MKCNCENQDCGHDDGCTNMTHPSGAYKVMYVGGVCMTCFYMMPKQYRIQDGANRRKIIEEYLETKGR